MEKRENDIPRTMETWAVTTPGPIDGKKSPIELIEKPALTPKRGEVLVKVLTCGVCHTDLHVTEGDLPVHHEHVTPGHEIVGKVVGFGPETQRFKLGEWTGILWFQHACGACKFCRSGHKNLCPRSFYTGRDHDGSYTEYVTVPEGSAYRLPERFDSLEAAPLLCAGIIGYRVFERADVPAGGRLGLYDFGGSAHITVQITLTQGIEVYVSTRGKDVKKFALELGCASVQGSYGPAPVSLDSSIIFAPVGDMVLPILTDLVPGGTLALVGIHMTDIPMMNYQKEIFHEKTLTSVESNTRRDGEKFLVLADRLNIHPGVHEYPLAKADEALRYVKHGDIKGVCVLRVSED